METFSADEIEKYRRLFPVTREWTYLNHAGVAPISSRVWEAIAQAGQEALHEGYTAGPRWHRHTEEVRTKAAAFLGVTPDEIAFVKNTSHGLSLVARGLGLKAGDEVVISDAEFPTNVYPWMALEKTGVVIKKIREEAGELKLDELASLVTPQTKVVSLSSVQYGSGFRLPVGEIGAFCRSRGIYFLLDAIQSLGAFALDAAAEQVDFLAADAHKWLLGQEGIGILYVRRDLADDFEPSLLGWNSVARSLRFDEIDYTLAPGARRFEEGTHNTLSIYGLGAALDLLTEAGIARVSRRILQLGDRLVAGLEELGLPLANSLNPKYRSGIVAFRLPGDSGEDRLQALERHLFAKKIYASVRRQSLRVSPHFYNTEAELDRLLEEIKSFMNQTGAG